jgi:hypothetical protein
MEFINVPPEALQLPENYIPPVRLEKRMGLKPDFSTFNDGQKYALGLAQSYILNELKDDLGLPKYLSICLEGYAGTGKTYWENQFILWLLTECKKIVRATAPTNKAVNVVSDNAEYTHPKLKHMTVHKLLGLKEVQDDQGNLSFQPDFENPAEIEEIDTLIVDEGSMFPDELFDMIYDYVNKGLLKLIFIGDSFQIPPVGKDDCIPFTAKGRMKYKIGLIKLEQIVRQAADSPIISYSVALREGRREEYLQKLLNENNTITQIVNGSGIIDLEKSAKDTIYGICDLYFNSPMFEMNPDFFKVVAWRNKTVDAVNDKVRSLIYKDKVITKLMIGEKLLAKKPIVEMSLFGPSILYTTNQEFEIIDYSITSGEVYRSKQKEAEDIVLECKYYVVRTIDQRTKKEKIIEVIHEDDEGLINELVAKLKKNAQAMKNSPNKQIRAWLWKNYYAVQRRFANIGYNYAITGHNSLETGCYKTSLTAGISLELHILPATVTIVA